MSAPTFGGIGEVDKFGRLSRAGRDAKVETHAHLLAFLLLQDLGGDGAAGAGSNGLCCVGKHGGRRNVGWHLQHIPVQPFQISFSSFLNLTDRMLLA